jgi:hypothetical protein
LAEPTAAGSAPDGTDATTSAKAATAAKAMSFFM